MALTNTGGRYALDDTFLKQKIKEIVAEYNITTIVETGIHEGRSTLELSYMVDKVIGIEFLQEAVDTTKQRLSEHNRTNVDLYTGNSPEILTQIMDTLDAERCIFFLDAHWWDYWPINDEIRCLSKNKGIIIVHDIIVPNRPDLKG
jgi:predicted O-methyltransferase YrrM